MDFLDLCEHAAVLAQQEADLRRRYQEARTRDVVSDLPQLAEVLEALAMEKRIALGRAVHYAEPGAGKPPQAMQ